MTKKKRLKVSLIGLGNMGKNHLRILSILKNVDIHYIFDVNEKTLNALSNQYQVKATNNIETALEGADAVIICSPTSLHYEHFMLASQYTKSIFVEKPLADTVEKSLEIKDVAEKNNISVQVGFIERFNPAVVELKNVIREDRVVNIDFTRTNKLSSRITDVDVVLDLMIHDIDLAIYLNGPVKDVYAVGEQENNFISFGSVMLKHENNSHSRLIASRITEKKERSIKATCEFSYVDCDLLTKEIVINRQSHVNNDERTYNVSSVQEHVYLPLQEALLTEIQAFVEVGMGNDVDAPSVEAGVEALKVCQEIQKQVLS